MAIRQPFWPDSENTTKTTTMHWRPLKTIEDKCFGVESLDPFFFQFDLRNKNKNPPDLIESERNECGSMETMKCEWKKSKQWLR